MKKFLSVFLIFITALSISLGLSACSLFPDSETETSGGGSSQSGSQSQTPQLSTPTSPITVTVRTETAKITDSGRASQKMDILYLSNYFNVRSAYNEGYTKLHVTFTFDVREIDDGYQYVFLYSDTKCKGNSFIDKIIDEVYDPADPSLLYEHRLEHGGTKKNTSWGSHTFNATISLSRLTDNLYIRYGASGKFDDDWENKNIVVTFQVAK